MDYNQMTTKFELIVDNGVYDKHDRYTLLIYISNIGVRNILKKYNFSITRYKPYNTGIGTKIIFLDIDIFENSWKYNRIKCNITRDIIIEIETDDIMDTSDICKLKILSEPSFVEKK